MSLQFEKAIGNTIWVTVTHLIGYEESVTRFFEYQLPKYFVSIVLSSFVSAIKYAIPIALKNVSWLKQLRKAKIVFDTAN